jgi:hypothetical protein
MPTLSKTRQISYVLIFGNKKLPKQIKYQQDLPDAVEVGAGHILYLLENPAHYTQVLHGVLSFSIRT